MSELVKNPKYCISVTVIRKNQPQKDFDSCCHIHAVVKKNQVDSKTIDLALFLSECSCITKRIVMHFVTLTMVKSL